MGIELGLVVVVVCCTTGAVEVTAVATASDTVLAGKDLSASLTLNHLFMGVLVLFFLSVALLGLEPSVVRWFCQVSRYLCMVDCQVSLLIPGRSAFSLSWMGKDGVWDSMVCMT